MKNNIQKIKKKPTFMEGFFPLIFMILSLVIGYGYFKLRAEPLLILSTFVAALIAIRLGYNWQEMQHAIIEKIYKTMPSILVLWSVGFLIGAWMFSGTVPMIIYYGIQISNPKFFLISSFVITSIVSTVTGSSWGSAGTIGVALIGIADGLGINLAAASGAIISGSYFGDKLSPLSDTTNLAPIVSGSELYEHIKHMLYTSIPSAFIAALVYYVAGFNNVGSDISFEKVSTLLKQLDSIFNWNILLFLPVILVLLGSIKKWPSIPTMLIASFLSIILGIFFQGFTLKDGFISMVNGFSINMASYNGEISKDIIKLINRGGISYVTSTTVLIFSAMGFAGIMTKTGMLDVVLKTILKRVKSTFGIICSTIVSCITIAISTGSSYLTIIIPGELFKDIYIKNGLHPKNLSRTLEDSGTVIVPLIPWSAAATYMSSTLYTSTLEYLPWTVFNYMGIVFAIIFSFTQVGITKLSKEEKEEFEKGT